MKKKSQKAEDTPVSEEPSKLSLEESLSNLTAKNTDYVFDIRRQLSQSGKSDEEIKTILTDILPNILNAQKNGLLARNLLGTPTEFVAQYKPKAGEKPKKETNKNPYLMILDSFLLLFALLGGLFGLMMEFQKSTIVYGLTTLFLSSAIGALGMYMVYRQQTKTLNRQSGEKLTFIQRLLPTLLLIGFMIIWMIVTTFSALFPTLKLDGITLIIIGAVTFGIRFLVKRHYNIQSAIVSRYAMESDKK